MNNYIQDYEVALKYALIGDSDNSLNRREITNRTERESAYGMLLDPEAHHKGLFPIIADAFEGDDKPTTAKILRNIFLPHIEGLRRRYGLTVDTTVRHNVHPFDRDDSISFGEQEMAADSVHTQRPHVGVDGHTLHLSIPLSNGHVTYIKHNEKNAEEAIETHNKLVEEGAISHNLKDTGKYNDAILDHAIERLREFFPH